MTFVQRMTTETGAPMPRWLYLLYKPVATLAAAVGLAKLTGLSDEASAWIVCALYVGIGLFAWYRHRRIVLTVAPGQFVGDFWYHGILSLPAPIILHPGSVALRWALTVASCALWWILDGANYGPMRSPDAP